jgi:putative oxidoreductase
MARAAHAHWLLRAGFASVFLSYGVGKFANLDGFAGMIRLPVFVAILVGLAEVGGALALIAGGSLRSDMLTRLGALAKIPVLIGAITLVHWSQWSFVASETHPKRIRWAAWSFRWFCS